jgi:SNF2 family DNA or RNA helicase
MVNVLRPYQEAAAAAMVRDRRKYLAFAPRMGKTPTTIVAANRLGVERPLVICPAIARDVWRAHWEAWGLPSARPVVVSYDFARQHAKDILHHAISEWDAVIIDEIHYAAHVEAKRTRAVLTVANQAPNAKLLAALSGSPIRSRPFDLYPTLRAIWPDKLRAMGVRRADQFRNMFEVPIFTGVGSRATVVQGRNLPMLRELLAELMIITSREQVAEQLPPLAWETVELDLRTAADQQRLERELEGYEDVLEAVRAGELPTSPAASTVRRLLGAVKAFPAAQVIAAELDARLLGQVVVGAYHLDVLNILEWELAPYGTARIDGSTSAHQRAQAIADFQNGRVRVMLAQLTAAGVAINLSAANDVLLVEQDWVPDTNMQFVDRIRTPDKEHPCTARQFVVRGSIDAHVAAVCRRKLRMAGQIVYGDD